jgi:hypothetical protein
MESLVLRNFNPAHSTQAAFWTSALLGATMRDLGIIGYLVVRGLIWDAGYAARRSLENVGVLAALWCEPKKAASLGSPEDENFRKAFVLESNSKVRAQLRARGTLKRFEFCIMAEGPSQLYTLLSKYTIHGGSPDGLAAAEIEPSAHSCMFVNRLAPSSSKISPGITIIGNACEMLAIEIAQVLGGARTRYGTTSIEGWRRWTLCFAADRRRFWSDGCLGKRDVTEFGLA